jgi:hypothetical protein
LVIHLYRTPPFQKHTHGCCPPACSPGCCSAVPTAPQYKTRMRPKGALGHPDGGFIFTAGLKTKEPASKWVMAGVALLTDIS